MVIWYWDDSKCSVADEFIDSFWKVYWKTVQWYMQCCVMKDRVDTILNKYLVWTVVGHSQPLHTKELQINRQISAASAVRWILCRYVVVKRELNCKEKLNVYPLVYLHFWPQSQNNETVDTGGKVTVFLWCQGCNYSCGDHFKSHRLIISLLIGGADFYTMVGTKKANVVVFFLTILKTHMPFVFNLANSVSCFLLHTWRDIL